MLSAREIQKRTWRLRPSAYDEKFVEFRNDQDTSIVQIGWRPDLSHEHYHTGPGIGSTNLKHLLRSPAHYLHSLEQPDEQTAAMRFGSISHLAILEPSEFMRRHVVTPTVDKRTKAGKEALAEFESKLLSWQIPITEEEAETLTGMLEAIQAHPIAAPMLEKGAAEVSGYFVHKYDPNHIQDPTERPILGRIRPDFLRTDRNLILDYKTTQDASEAEFVRSVVRYGYHLQASWYRAGYIAIEHVEPRFVFIAQEKEPPYAISLHSPDDAMIERGSQLYHRALASLNKALDEGRWPAYEPRVGDLSLPQYAFYD